MHRQVTGGASASAAAQRGDAPSDGEEQKTAGAPVAPSPAVEAEVSAPLRASPGLVQWSPCGRFLAVATSSRLTIREARSLQITQQFAAVDTVQSVAWSADSQLVLAAMLKRAAVQVWSVSDPSWTCRINEGVAGLAAALWTPDARHVLTVSDFQLHATVWSLTDASARCVLRSPKLAGDGLTFSPDGEFLAVAERHDCKDFVGVYSCDSWELAAHFPLESYDCVQMEWSPDNSCIAVRDSHLEFRVLLYSPNGELLANYKAYENALGIRTMEWSPSGHFLALGSYDDHLRVLGHLNWKPVAEFDHDELAVSLSRVNKDAVEYEEHYADVDVLERPQGKRIAIMQQSSSRLSNSLRAASAAAQAAGGKRARDIINWSDWTEVAVCSIRKENPKIGVSRVAWSSDSSFIATKSDQMPHNVWIWHVESMQGRVHLWSPRGIAWIDIPNDDFQVLGVRWASSGESLAALGRQSFCCLTF